jgi:dipeptidyl aminopeptidase/acylaminoacyl peptidase
MHPTDIAGLVSAGSPAVSPDGTRIAFAVATVDEPGNRYRSQIWLATADGRTPPRPLTAGDKGDGSPAWSPDGSTLAFTSHRGDKDEETTLHLLSVDGPGEVRTIAAMKGGVEELRWSPDGQYLAFASRTPDARYDESDPAKQPPRRITRFFSRLNGEDWVYDRPRHIYVVPADGTEPARNLTPGEYSFGGPAWLPDCSGVVCAGAAHDTWDRDLAEDLHIVPLEGERRALTKQTGLYTNPAASPDGTLVAFLGADDPLTEPQNAKVGVLDLESGEHRWVSAELDRTFAPFPGAQAPVWDGGELIASCEDRGNLHLYRVAPDASGPPLLAVGGERVITGFDSAGGTVAFTASTVERPPELYAIGPDGKERQLTSLTERFAARVGVVPAERFTAPSTDGVEVDTWVLTPPGFDPELRYPVLLNVHGGPFTQYGNRFFDEAQMQAAAGYIVVMGNPRGSSGRDTPWGQAVMGPHHPKAPGRGWGSADVEDVLATLDAALARYPAADPDRVGMLGGSYGGYMATWLAGTTTRFKAICSERAVNNLVSLEWNSDIATVFRTNHGVTHLEDPELYARMSPIRFVNDIATPMLILHSEDDLRCPINQADELFVALRLLGKEVEFHRFPAENHELSRSGSPAHRRQRMEIILDFFGRHLQPEPQPDPQPDLQPATDR